MSVAGAAVVAIWNDIADGGRDNFYQWHNREHMPERLGIDGFLRGRRYIAISGAPEFFTLYEVRDHSVLASKDYLERLNNPTEWTARSIKDFRNVSRSLCDVDFSSGKASGGLIATLNFDCDPGQDAATMSFIKDACTSVLDRAGMVAAHICRADMEASKAKTAEQKNRPENAVPRWVILLEASTLEAVQSIFSGPLSAKAVTAAALLQSRQGIYRLEFDLRKA